MFGLADRLFFGKLCRQWRVIDIWLMDVRLRVVAIAELREGVAR